MTYWGAVIQNALGCTLGSLVAIAASYGLYRLSTKAARDEIARNERETFELFTMLVQNVCHASETLINNLHQFTQDLLQTIDDFPELRYTPLNDFSRLSELQDLQKFLFSFTKIYPNKDNAVSDFVGILSKTYYLQAQFNTLPLQAEKGQHFHHQRQLQLKELVEQSEDALKNILIPLPTINPLVTLLGPIVSQYALQRHPQSPLSFHVNRFVRPLYQALITIQSQGGLINSDVNHLKGMTGKALGIFDHIPQHNQVLSADITVTLGEISRVYDDLKKIASNMITSFK